MSNSSADVVPFQLWLLLSHMCPEMQLSNMVYLSVVLPSEFSRQCKRQEGNYLEFHTQSCEEFVRSEEMRRRNWFGFPDSPGDIRIDRNTIHSKSAWICNGHSLQLVNLPLHLVCHSLHDRIRLQSNHLHKPEIPEDATKKRNGGVVQKPKFCQQTLHRFQNSTERKEAWWPSRLSLTFVKSSPRASKESSVPTRKSGTWNCNIQKTSAFLLQPLQHVTTTGSSKRIRAWGHLLCPANAMTNLVHWSKYELQSPHFPAYWIRSGNRTFRSAMKRNRTWIPTRKKSSSKGPSCA